MYACLTLNIHKERIMTMTEDQFLKTMIETIKYDDYEKRKRC